MAIERQGVWANQQVRAAWHVDLREQIISQAPSSATGYRLVVPGRSVGDSPSFSPKRSRARDVAAYSLSQFEYPDDVRLCDGHWYRIVWVEAQGMRIRLGPGESVPGLYYFVGPAQPGHSTHSIEQRSEPQERSPLQPDSKPPLSRSQERPSLLATFPSQLIAETTEDERSLLVTLSPLTLDDSSLLIRFVQQPEWMLQLLHEEKVAAAQTTGRPAPQEPLTSLSHHERTTIHELLTQRMPAPFILLCKLLHACARKYGPEALNFLPTPLPPLPEAEQQRLEAAILNTQKRMYLDYVHTRQESLLRSLPLPEEPQTSLSSKERSQLRRMLRDTRAVILFEKQVHPPLASLQS